MQNRFTYFKRGKVFYCEDRTTGQQKSLQTRDEDEAQRILQARNDTVKLPQMNLVMAKTYLSAQDPKMAARTWADVMERFCNRSNDNIATRCGSFTSRARNCPSPKPRSKSCISFRVAISGMRVAAQAVRTFNAFDTPQGNKFTQEYEVYSQRFQKEDFGDDEPFDPKVLPNEYLTNPNSTQMFVYVSTARVPLRCRAGHPRRIPRGLRSRRHQIRRAHERRVPQGRRRSRLD
jgi:hypothetical protein